MLCELFIKIYKFFSALNTLSIGFGIGALFMGGRIVACLFDLPNLDENGSGNVGASNMVRVSGKKYGALVLLIDMLKGYIPLFIFHQVIILGIAFGHAFPIYWAGGKSFAVFMGALLYLSPKLFLGTAAVWLVILGLFQMPALSSVISSILSVIVMEMFFTDCIYIQLAGVFSILVHIFK